jgi:hypothetical protein
VSDAQRAANRRYYYKNREDWSIRRRLKKYGLTKEQFDQMFEVQKGLCAICKFDLLKGIYGVAVDHDHVTGKVRGLLCHPCNRGLGQFQDSENLLEQAIHYLRGNL